MTLHFRKKGSALSQFLLNLAAALGFLVVFFGLISFMDSPSATNLPASDNPSGRPPPAKRYLPKDRDVKKPLKPSKPPITPRIPAPTFKSLYAPSKLPTVERIPTH